MKREKVLRLRRLIELGAEALSDEDALDGRSVPIN